MKTPAAADDDRAAKAALFSRFTQMLPGALAVDADPIGSMFRIHPVVSPAGSPPCEHGAPAGGAHGVRGAGSAGAFGPALGGPGGVPGSGQGAPEAPGRPLVSELLTAMRDVVAHDPGPHQNLFRCAAGRTEPCHSPFIALRNNCGIA